MSSFRNSLLFLLHSQLIDNWLRTYVMESNVLGSNYNCIYYVDNLGKDIISVSQVFLCKTESIVKPLKGRCED